VSAACQTAESGWHQPLQDAAVEGSEGGTARMARPMWGGAAPGRASPGAFFVEEFV